MVLEDSNKMIAFAMGYFEQYDDGFAYDLIEIVVTADYQKRGVGTGGYERAGSKSKGRRRYADTA